MNVETERTAKWRDTIMVYFNTLFHYLAGGIEEKDAHLTRGSL
jgi:hypothetical protein